MFSFWILDKNQRTDFTFIRAEERMGGETSQLALAHARHVMRGVLG